MITIMTITMTTAMITTIIMTMTTSIADHHGGLKHYHDEEMQSISLKTDKPLDADKFFPWVEDLVQKEGPNILRSKGILSFKDDDERFVFQGVHMIIDGDHQRPWKEDEKRQSRIVFIGRNLPKQLITEGFDSCISLNYQRTCRLFRRRNYVAVFGAEWRNAAGETCPRRRPGGGER